MRPIDADELCPRLMARYEAHNLDDTRDMAARAAIMSCMEAVERSKTITIPQPPNDPLTLNELREMDGEPVWCIIIDGDYKGESFWGLVSIDTAECICSDWDVIIFAYYGKTWLAYRRKPEDGTT